MSLVHDLVSFVLRTVMLLAGLVFAASLLVAGLVLGLGMVVWSLLRGHRPVSVRWRMKRGGGTPGWFEQAAASQRARHGGHDVVDVQAREVHVPQGRLPPGE